MAGLVPAIHVFMTVAKQGVDARDKAGHDEHIVLQVLQQTRKSQALLPMPEPRG
jgi:hypothetical protein